MSLDLIILIPLNTVSWSTKMKLQFTLFKNILYPISKERNCEVSKNVFAYIAHDKTVLHILAIFLQLEKE
jgi:hypothetical protein